jgi:hypothetical protein
MLVYWDKTKYADWPIPLIYNGLAKPEEMVDKMSMRELLWPLKNLPHIKRVLSLVKLSLNEK